MQVPAPIGHFKGSTSYTFLIKSDHLDLHIFRHGVSSQLIMTSSISSGLAARLALTPRDLFEYQPKFRIIWSRGSGCCWFTSAWIKTIKNLKIPHNASLQCIASRIWKPVTSAVLCFVYYLSCVSNPNHSAETEWAPCDILDQIIQAFAVISFYNQF